MGLNTAYRKLRAMKTSRTRMNLLWGYVVTASQRNLPTKPRDVVYDWAFYDRAIRRARRRGIKVQLTLTGPAPAWATPTRNVDTGYIKPNVRLFKKFVKKVAHRYRRKVDRFAIWNEPNWYKWLGPLKTAPRQYRRLYIAGYKAIKRKAPRARILLGETSPNAPAGDRDRAAQVPARDDVPEPSLPEETGRQTPLQAPAARRRRRAPSVRLRQVAADEAQVTRRRDDRGARPAQPRAQEDEAPARRSSRGARGGCRST